MTVPADVVAPPAAPEPQPSPPTPAPARARVLRPGSLLLELIIVTAGVLIALSVDTVRVWRSHQSLAAEARATMLTEVTENKKALENAMVSLEATKKAYQVALAEARARLAGKRLETGDVNLNFNAASLSTAAFTTAEITGALGHMKYDDVRRFASVYEAQKRFLSLQDQLSVDLWTTLTPIMIGRDLSGARPQELELWTRGLEEVLSGLMLLTGYGEGLRLAYGGLLDQK